MSSIDQSEIMTTSRNTAVVDELIEMRVSASIFAIGRRSV
jgi:hypothetical protein